MNILGKEIKFWIKCALASVFASTVIGYFDFLNNVPDEAYKAISSVIAQIGITLVGFVLASLAILATMSHYKLIRNMQKTGHFRVLLRRMFVCVCSFLFLTITSIVMLFHQKSNIYLAYLFIFVLFFSLLLFIDMIRKFWMVLHHLHPE